MPPGTLPQLLLEALYPPKDNIFEVREGNVFRPISTNAFMKMVRELTLAFSSSGLKKGRRAAILSENRLEWTVADLAVQCAGGVLVPLYHTLNPGQIDHILRDSKARFLIVSGSEPLDNVIPIIDGLPKLKTVICLEELGDVLPRCVNYHEFAERGAKIESVKPGEFRELCASVEPEDLSSLIYTSGTTGTPRGVMLTHRNITSNVAACCSGIDVNEKDRALSVLPLSHVFERTVDFAYLHKRVTLCHVPDINETRDYMMKFRPTVMAGVPRLYEKIHTSVLEKALGSGLFIRNLSFWAFKRGKRAAYDRLRKREPSAPFRLLHYVADRLVLSKIRRSLGGGIRLFVSGGAPLSRETAYFFLGAGLPIVEGYGLTETSPVVTLNDPDDIRPGTVGKPLEGVDVKIDDDGEILVRGPNVMKGYYGLPDDTKNTFKDGWLKTGDIGRMDRNGNLVITDRKKDIIVTSGGKNVAPLKVENLLTGNRFISQAVVVGDGRKYISALIVPDFEVLEEYADYKGLKELSRPELLNHERIKNLFRRQVDKCTSELSRYEKIKTFKLMEREFTQEAEELTPTLKIRRGVIIDRYGDAVKNLYES